MRPAQQKMISYMRCVNAFFIDITNIFVRLSCHLNQKDTLRIPYECLCVILTLFFVVWGTGGSAHLHGLIFSSIPSPCDVNEFLIKLYHYSVRPKNKKQGTTARALPASEG